MSDATAIRLPSEQNFGITFAIALSFVAIYVAFRDWGWMSCVAARKHPSIHVVPKLT